MEGRLQVEVKVLEKLNVDQRWEIIKTSIEGIYEGDILTRAAYMTLLTHVYEHLWIDEIEAHKAYLLSRRAGPYIVVSVITLYDKIKGFLTDFLKERIAALADLSGEPFVFFHNKLWNAYHLGSKVLHSVCGHLNNWVKKRLKDGNKDVYVILQLAMMTWKELVFVVHQQNLSNAMLALIDQQRQGQNINMRLIGDAASSFIAMGQYTKRQGTLDDDGGLITYELHFEAKFLQSSKVFYIRESASFLEKHSMMEYVKKFQQMLVDEETMCHLHLQESTLEKLMNICNTLLIQRQMEFIEQELKNCLAQHRNEDFCRVYRFLSRCKGGLVYMALEFGNLVYEQGLAIVERIDDVVDKNLRAYVTVVAEHVIKLEQLVKVHLKEDSAFKDVLNKALKKFINENAVTKACKFGQSPSEQLARYCDHVLNNSKTHLDVDECIDILGNVMILFKYVEDKVAFRTFYTRMLATRLLQNGSIGEEAEVFVLCKLKETVGFEYSWNMQNMIKDIGLSKNLNFEFVEWRQTNTYSLPYSFYFEVLSAGSWPFTQCGEFTLPVELELGVRRAVEFYSTKFDDRSLIWLHNRSKGEIITNCFKKRYTFKASAFQMGVLLMFNSNDKYKIRELAQATTLKLEILIQVLQGLLKARLLVLPDKENEVNLVESTQVQLCKEYRNKKICINLSLPIKAEVKKEKELSLEVIEKDRKALVQSALVRILKVRKQLKHQELIAEVICQLNARFNPSVELIKKCIEILIEKDYIMRSLEDMDVYNYVV